MSPPLSLVRDHPISLGAHGALHLYCWRAKSRELLSALRQLVLDDCESLGPLVRAFQRPLAPTRRRCGRIPTGECARQPPEAVDHLTWVGEHESLHCVAVLGDLRAQLGVLNGQLSHLVRECLVTSASLKGSVNGSIQD